MENVLFGPWKNCKWTRVVLDVVLKLERDKDYLDAGEH